MKDRIEEIRERMEKASEGPWKQGEGLVFQPFNEVTRKPGIMIADVALEKSLPELGHGNGDFIAHAREDIPYLLDLLDAKETP